MPRQAAAKGRADYPATLDTRWREATSGPVGQQFVGAVVVRDPDTVGEYDEDTHTRPRVPGAVVYDGPARLVPVGAVGSTPDNAGQTVTLRGYRLSIPFPGAAFKPGQKAQFSGDDPVLSSQVLTVTSNQAATTRLQTDVMLEADEG